MENSGLLELSAGGIFAFLIIKEVFFFVSKRNGNGKTKEHDKVENMIKKIHDLWHWHAPDPDGEQGWKGKQLERIMISLDQNVQENTSVVKQGTADIVSKLDDLKRELRQ